MNSISYCQSRLTSMGVTPELNKTSYLYKGNTKEGDVFEADEHDNIRILYLDPNGVQATYQNPQGATVPYYRKRLKTPVGSMKYQTPKNAPALPFIPPQLVQKVSLGAKIQTLLLTEGEFKAFIACHNGLDCIGIPGIFQFKERGGKTLHPWILQVIATCQVERILLLLDGDAVNLISDESQLSAERLLAHDMDRRSNNFCSAFKQFKECVQGLDIDAYVGHILPGHNQKGLDDLLLSFHTETAAIKADALALAGAGDYFRILSLVDNSNFKLNALFGLNDVAEFYELHREKIREKDFRFQKAIYRYNPESGIPERSEIDFTTFWFYDSRKYCKVDLKKCLDLLHANGFRLHRLSVNDYILVRVFENVVREISTKEVKDFLIGYVADIEPVSELEKDAVTNALLSHKNLFSLQVLNALQCIPDDFHADTETSIFFYYRNCFVEISKETITPRPYSELGRFIWQSQMLQRDFCKAEEAGLETFVFSRFVSNITSTKDKNGKVAADASRLGELHCLLGYCMHLSKKERKAILFTDMDINDTPEGRTGKGILSDALARMRVVTPIDGKRYNPDDRFRFQQASLDTQILYLNDVGSGKRPFDFEHLFAAVTEGVEVEKKNRPSFRIHPTILISSNRVIQINGGSAKARVLEFEVSNYYSNEFSPKDDFSQWFFDDWKEAEWHLFDLFMMNCCRTYLANGVKKPVTVNLDKKKLMDATSHNTDFFDFMEATVKPNTQYNKTILLEDFRGDQYLWVKPNTFTKWLKTYAQFKGWNYANPEPKSNGIRYAEFRAKS